MRRVLLILVLLLWVASAVAQAPGVPVPMGWRLTPATLNTMHQTWRGLVGWWIVQPTLAGGGTWWNVLPWFSFTLTNMGSGSGWQSTVRPGGAGEMRVDGTDDYLDGTTNSRWDFADQTFTVFVRFRSTAGASRQYLVAKADVTTASGGWFLRIHDNGSVMARTYNGSALKTTENTTVSTDNGAGGWKSTMVVFRTDTSTASNNTLTLYTNGVLDQNTPATATNTYAGCSSCGFFVGASSDAPINGFSAMLAGAIDDLRIWNRGLSAAEALAVHRQGPPTFGGVVQPLPLVVGTPVAGPPSSSRRRGMSQ